MSELLPVALFGTVFYWVGFISSCDVSHFLHSYSFVNTIILFIICCIVLYKCSEILQILLRTNLHLFCTLCVSFSSDFLLLSLLPQPLSSSLIHVYISSFLAPLVLHEPKFPFPSNIHLFFLLPSTSRAFIQLSVSLIRYLPLFYPFSFHCHDN